MKIALIIISILFVALAGVSIGIYNDNQLLSQLYDRTFEEKTNLKSEIYSLQLENQTLGFERNRFKTELEQLDTKLLYKDELIERQARELDEHTNIVQGLESGIARLKYDMQVKGVELEFKIDQLTGRNLELINQVKNLTFELGEDMLFMPSFGDCDDSTLLMYLYFESLGYDVRIISGNLNLTGESIKQADHCWVIVTYGGRHYPYDWGHYCSDSQHHEGYYDSYKSLIAEALSD